MPAYRPSSWLGTLASVVIVINALCFAVVSVTDGYGRWKFATWDDMNADVSAGTEETLLLFVGTSWLLLLAIWIVAAVVFCMWLYRVAVNARALGIQHLEHTPGWAVGWFFVPIMNLFRPYQAVKELWQSSDPLARPDSWSHLSSTTVGVWWAFWILANLGSRVLDKVAEGFAGSPTALAIGVFDVALYLSAAFFAVAVVRGLSGRQDRKAELLSSVETAEATA